MERNNWSILYRLHYRCGDPTVFLQVQNNTCSSLMINVNENSIFNQKMTVIAQLNIKQTINHITCCSVKAIYKLWIRYFNTTLEFTKLRWSAFRRLFQCVTIHAHTGFQIRIHGFRRMMKETDCCSLPPPPSRSPSIYSIGCARWPMTMVLERSGFGRGFPLEAVVDNTRNNTSTGGAVCRHKGRQ